MLTRDLHDRITQWEAEPFLFAAGRVRRRIEVLDQMDACGVAEGRLTELRGRLETANAEVYARLRGAIRGGDGRQLLPFLEEGEVAAGLSYDYRDELVSGVLDLREPGRVAASADAEMVFYQPTPVRHVLRLIGAGGISVEDVLVDLGSGLGHVALLVSILTGARCVGVELDSALVCCARECAGKLGLDRVAFMGGDARTVELAGGTAFYLYTPFTGAMLRDVLKRLKEESERRSIRVCTLGPCAAVVAQEHWLEASAEPDADRITVFRSRG
jgi:hypothetical protein